jgi:peptidyl-dipeptidase A
MGHINYFILYKNLPIAFRSGANPGFHEAVGDLIALSVSTPKHLQKIGFLDDYKDTEADNINALFKMALERVSFLPFGLLIDKWRWNVFSQETPESEWNKHWWELREKYQKVKAPNSRGEEFFDPGAKYHIPADSQYIAYFIAHLLQFQLHRSVCLAANQYDPNNPLKPLHKCDIDGSKEAGKLIRDGLELGYSKHWSVALEKMTGEKEIKGSAVVEYFKPLYDFLKKNNEMENILTDYNDESSKLCNKQSIANWDVTTDIGNKTKEEKQDQAIVEYAQFRKQQFELHFKNANPNEYEADVKRQLMLLKDMGTAALDDNDLSALNANRNKMSGIYNSARICPFDKQNCDLATEGLTLDPDIELKLASSTNYDEMQYIWV